MEKVLYGTAQLARINLHAWQMTERGNFEGKNILDLVRGLKERQALEGVPQEVTFSP